MALTNDQITAQNFKDFYGQIRPYLNGAAHSGFTPVGTIISVMGKTAPMNYLACDGSVVNIADYPELAAYFAGQFEAANFFGGDGVTTFAVPDLRGEFLRGTGTNSHTNQGSGAAVGVHQDGTEHHDVIASFNKVYSVTDSDYAKNSDSRIATNLYTNSSQGSSGTSSGYGRYTSRPTNTSVLYCIATKNIFMDAGMNFSTEEQVVGTWIDSKPIYQKSISMSSWTVGHGISNLGDVISCTGVLKNGNMRFLIPYVSDNAAGYRMTFVVDDTNIDIQHGSAWAFSPVVVTLRYTKTTD